MDSVTRFTAWLATAATLSFAAPGQAAPGDARLDELFRGLSAARSVEEAHPLEQAIWDIWLVAPSEFVGQWMQIGLRAMASQDHKAALGAFDEVVALAPGFAEGWNKRATIHYLLGNLDQSAADIERTLALEPRHFGALSGLGLINMALGRDRAALAAFEAAAGIHPQMPGAALHIIELRRKLQGRQI